MSAQFDGNRIAATNPARPPKSELENLIYRVKTLGHKDELTVSTLEAIVARLAKEELLYEGCPNCEYEECRG